jgi:hypothetical protein
MRCAYTTVVKAISAAILSMPASVALADGTTTSLSGYGTVGGSFTSDGKYAYDHNASEFTGASNSLDIGLESRIGVQAVVSFDPQWSITAQELLKRRGSKNFDPGTEWLYAQYQPDPHLKLRLGRVVLPVFLVSDTINVGYAVPWLRAPNEVYFAEPLEYLDGGQALWQHSLGPLQLKLEATYGDAEANLEIGGISVVAQSKSTFNAAISLSWRSLLVRYAETGLNSTATLPTSAKVLSYRVQDRFQFVGLQYDDGKALLMSEWTKRDENILAGLGKPFAEDTSWYAAVGWRFGKLTPLAMYSVLNITDSILQNPASYHTWGASLRYDVLRNLDLKLQISRAQAGNSSYWVVRNLASNERVNVYSLGADFVF